MVRSIFVALTILVASLAAAQTPPLLGVWLLNGKEKAVRFAFRRDGTFSYKGYASESSGTWASNGTIVKLAWVRVDGAKVKPGSVCASYPVADGVLRIGTFKYQRPLAATR